MLKHPCDDYFMLRHLIKLAALLILSCISFYIHNFSLYYASIFSSLTQLCRYLLENGYAVIFLHRRGSLEPYRRHLHSINLLDILNLKDGHLIGE